MMGVEKKGFNQNRYYIIGISSPAVIRVFGIREQYFSIKNIEIIFKKVDIALDKNIAKKVNMFGKSVILILEKPWERARNMHNYMLRYGYEHIESLELALCEENKRFYSQNFRKTTNFWRYMYWRGGIYWEQVKILKNVCGKVETIPVENIIDNTKHSNKSKCNTWNSIIPLNVKLQYLLRIAYSSAESSNQKNIIEFMMGLNNFLGRITRREKTEKEKWINEFLKEIYFPDVEKLSEIVGIDFIGIWYEEAS